MSVFYNIAATASAIIITGGTYYENLNQLIIVKLKEERSNDTFSLLR